LQVQDFVQSACRIHVQVVLLAAQAEHRSRFGGRIRLDNAHGPEQLLTAAKKAIGNYFAGEQDSVDGESASSVSGCESVVDKCAQVGWVRRQYTGACSSTRKGMVLAEQPEALDRIEHACDVRNGTYLSAGARQAYVVQD